MAKNPIAHEIMNPTTKAFIFQNLAQGYTPKETTDFTIAEFAMDWAIDPTNEAGKARLVTIRSYLYQRCKDWLYEVPKAKAEIASIRRQWIEDIENTTRDASKSFRIAEYSRIKELCIRTKDYRSALLAMKLIAMEKGDLSVGLNVRGNVSHTHKVQTESEIDARIKAIVNGTDATPEEKQNVIALLNKN